MAEFVIREATDEDGEALLALLAKSWSAYDGCGFEAADHPLLGRPASHFAERDGQLWLVMHGDEIAGSLGLARHARPKAFELSLICLEETLRGQGLAAALLAGADAFAATSGGESLTVWIDTRLVDGVRFLERQGFVREPGIRRRHDGSEALDAHFSRAVAPRLSLQPSEDRPVDAV